MTANVAPGLMAEFMNAYLSGDEAEAVAIDARLQPIHEILFVESSPAPTKWALHEMGRIDVGIRLPLLPLSEAARPGLRQRLVEAGAL